MILNPIMPRLITWYGNGDLGGSIGSANFPGSTVAGSYRISLYLAAYSVTAGGSTVYATFTHYKESTTRTITSATLTINTITDLVQAPYFIEHQGGNAMTYATTFAAGAGDGRYSIYITLERVK